MQLPVANVGSLEPAPELVHQRRIAKVVHVGNAQDDDPGSVGRSRETLQDESALRCFHHGNQVRPCQQLFGYRSVRKLAQSRGPNAETDIVSVDVFRRGAAPDVSVADEQYVHVKKLLPALSP
jgi:hypothetical protein